jgi:hypothetical protein
MRFASRVPRKTAVLAVVTSGGREFVAGVVYYWESRMIALRG